ncbi:ATP-binding protein [Actinocorallia longicatena]|uniref:CobQ/CobB/MinD/ParA nucleotide binding domain-containing protein n=1 Tax=Actinocorallia longicatena TaxID=111803 RepID=A0ABP6QMX5_9ACTN
MKVAFVGKGGSGKTTLSSLFIRHLAGAALPVVAVDADINQHLGVALGLDEGTVIPALGDHLTEIKEYLRGTNPRISSAAAMVKTTPPGEGSRLLRVGGGDLFHRDLALELGPTLRLMVTGPFSDDDLGVACYHSKTGAVELYLNHLVDGEGEYVVVDMTAGADTFASGLFTRFDVMFLVAEPTRKGVSVYRQYVEYARDFDVTIKVVGNKVHDEQDLDYLRTEVGDDLLTWFGHSSAVRAIEQGRPGAHLEDAGIAALDLLRKTVDAHGKDWPKFQRQAAEFHVRNARSWANRATGEDLEAQLDPAFVIQG